MNARLRSATTAIFLGLVLLAPASMAVLCGLDAGCNASPVAAATDSGNDSRPDSASGTPSSHCETMAREAMARAANQASEPPEPVLPPEPALELCCCPGNDVVLAGDQGLAAVSERLQAPAPSSALLAPQVSPQTALACRSGPQDPSPVRPAGRTLLTLHQTFLN